jgi:hypothetical protein
MNFLVFRIRYLAHFPIFPQQTGYLFGYAGLKSFKAIPYPPRDRAAQVGKLYQAALALQPDER